MMAPSILGSQIRTLPVRRITVDDPNRWLAAGWRDFRRAPLLSLGYGALFVIAGYAIVFGLYNVGLASLVPTAIAGFFLVAPILAVGLYEISRRFERGEQPSFADTVGAIRRNPGGLSGIGLVLILCLAAWLQIALLIFMLFFHQAPPSLDHFFYDILTARDALPFLLVGTAIGYVIASLVFAISAVSIPMLLDRDVPLLVAVATSVVAVRENWLVMLGWAATIVLLVGIGLATFFVGLIVTLPLVAYATWHAYRGIVE
ncbi:DUF2189 domain-containing protein [Telmatospirillum sp.]|uniref:DUF2189 domain-containing protein n=1 Tax=Telmatospirillum sp. TaxID=2079197 RepID=UPI00283B696D|nr:DUF2189 domain-containing protein [Telmatospirillum sp.]MDR3440284.1 DUF2189 domain-containing protein [Telmatospirillum sp.]